MSHIDNYFSYTGNGTKVAFKKDGITQIVKIYQHSQEGEWDRRKADEKEWRSQGDNYDTNFIK